MYTMRYLLDQILDRRGSMEERLCRIAGYEPDNRYVRKIPRKCWNIRPDIAMQFYKISNVHNIIFLLLPTV